MLRLPEARRDAFKDPLGPVYEGPDVLLADADEPIVAVGDVVTYHLRRVGRDPDVALVDGRTEREAVDEELRQVILHEGPERREMEATNDPGTLSRDLLETLRAAIDADEPVVLRVHGEEDLAALPAIIALPLGGSVVYGQPEEGMVLVRVDEASKADARELLDLMEGDVEAMLAPLVD